MANLASPDFSLIKPSVELDPYAYDKGRDSAIKSQAMQMENAIRKMEYEQYAKKVKDAENAAQLQNQLSAVPSIDTVEDPEQTYQRFKQSPQGQQAVATYGEAKVKQGFITEIEQRRARSIQTAEYSNQAKTAAFPGALQSEIARQTVPATPAQPAVPPQQLPSPMQGPPNPPVPAVPARPAQIPGVGDILANPEFAAQYPLQVEAEKAKMVPKTTGYVNMVKELPDGKLDRIPAQEGSALFNSLVKQGYAIGDKMKPEKPPAEQGKNAYADAQQVALKEGLTPGTVKFFERVKQLTKDPMTMEQTEGAAQRIFNGQTTLQQEISNFGGTNAKQQLNAALFTGDRKNFSEAKAAQNLALFEKVDKNLGRLNAILPRTRDLLGKMEGLKNNDIPVTNAIKNWIGRELGDDKIVDFDTLKLTIVQEANTALSGSSQQSKERFDLDMKNLNSAQNPKQLAAAAGNFYDSLAQLKSAIYAGAWSPEQVMGRKVNPGEHNLWTDMWDEAQKAEQQKGQLRGGKTPVGGKETPKAVLRTGIVTTGPNKGQRVTEYSDGTKEYK